MKFTLWPTDDSHDLYSGEILSDDNRGLMMPAGKNWQQFRKVCGPVNPSSLVKIPYGPVDQIYSGFA